MEEQGETQAMRVPQGQEEAVEEVGVALPGLTLLLYRIIQHSPSAFPDPLLIVHHLP